jgi:hypothetical protein
VDAAGYANVVATLAFVLAAVSLFWQIKSNLWDRPNIVFMQDRVMTQTSQDPSTGREADLGWLAEVIVSNTGNFETTILSVEWEFDCAPNDDPSIFVGGTIGEDGRTTDREDIAPGQTKTTLKALEDNPFQQTVMGRNHSKPYAYRIGPTTVDGPLRDVTRARPVAQVIDRKRHGVTVKHGDWTLAPGRHRKGPLPPEIRVTGQ